MQRGESGANWRCYHHLTSRRWLAQCEGNSDTEHGATDTRILVMHCHWTANGRRSDVMERETTTHALSDA